MVPLFTCLIILLQSGDVVGVEHSHAVAFMERARGLARQYAKEKKLPMRQTALPQIVMCADEDEVLKRSGAPCTINARTYAITSFKDFTVYLDAASTPDILLHEAGHWFLHLSCEDSEKFVEWASRRDEKAEKGLRRLLTGNK